MIWSESSRKASSLEILWKRQTKWETSSQIWLECRLDENSLRRVVFCFWQEQGYSDDLLSQTWDNCGLVWRTERGFNGVRIRVKPYKGQRRKQFTFTIFGGTRYRGPNWKTACFVNHNVCNFFITVITI